MKPVVDLIRFTHAALISLRHMSKKVAKSYQLSRFRSNGELLICNVWEGGMASFYFRRIRQRESTVTEQTESHSGNCSNYTTEGRPTPERPVMGKTVIDL